MLTLPLCESLRDLLLCSSGRIPPHDADLFFHVRSSANEHLEHGAVVLHVDGDLLVRLRVEHRKGMRHAHRRRRRSCAKKRPDDAVLPVCATKIVIEDGKQGRGVDRQRRRAWSDRNFSVNNIRCYDSSTYGVAPWLACDVFWMQIADETGMVNIFGVGIPCFFSVVVMPSEETKVRPSSTTQTASSQFCTGTHHKGRRRHSRTCLFFLTDVNADDRVQTVLHYGWIPLIIYIGYTRSSPQPTLIK